MVIVAALGIGIAGQLSLLPRVLPAIAVGGVSVAGSLILAVLLVYAVMASQYESLKDPFIIMFSVPLAAIGVVLALKLTGTSFSLQAYIGVIMLAVAL